MTYKPLPNSVTIKSSDISGLGLFAAQPLKKATYLGTTHHKIDVHIIRTPLGGFINHSDTPNCVKVELLLSEGSFRKKWNLMTIKNIKEGEELTLTYTFYEMKIPKKKSWIEGYKEWRTECPHN
jgi:SET domain-containing protein